MSIMILKFFTPKGMHVMIVLIILIYFKLKWLEVPFRGILGQNYPQNYSKITQELTQFLIKMDYLCIVQALIYFCNLKLNLQCFCIVDWVFIGCSVVFCNRYS